MRLIDADKIIQWYSETHAVSAKDLSNLIFLQEIVKNMPTVDAKPVIRAHWKIKNKCYLDDSGDYELFSIAICSNCGEKLHSGETIRNESFATPEEYWDEEETWQPDLKKLEEEFEKLPISRKLPCYCEHCGAIMEEKMTNYEWVRSLTADEMATLLDSVSSCNRCRKRENSCFPMSMNDWLEQEHIESGTDKESGDI